MGDNMDAETRVTALSSQHLYLEHAISQENQRPSPDFIRITELKREKLRIKDEIVRLEQH